MIQAHDSAEQALALGRDTPAAAAWHLGYQPAHVQPLQPPSHRCRLTPASALLPGLTEQGPADVGVAEALQRRATCQHGTEQLDVLLPRWIEPRIAAAALHLGLGQFLDAPIRRL